MPVAGLSVGYPSQAGWISMRLPPSSPSTLDRYDDSDFTAQIEDFDRRREARHATPPSQRFVDRFGPPSPTAGRRTRRGNTPSPAPQLRPLIRRHGFGLA